MLCKKMTKAFDYSQDFLPRFVCMLSCGSLLSAVV